MAHAQIVKPATVRCGPVISSMTGADSYCRSATLRDIISATCRRCAAHNWQAPLVAGAVHLRRLKVIDEKDAVTGTQCTGQPPWTGAQANGSPLDAPFCPALIPPISTIRMPSSTDRSVSTSSCLFRYSV